MPTKSEPNIRTIAQRVALVFIAFGIVVISVGACLPTGRACNPGDYLPCTCAGDVAGAALCDEIGSSYGMCDCTILLDAGTDVDVTENTDAASDANDSGGPCSGEVDLQLTCACNDNSNCASDFCFTYPSKGPHCSAHCTTDAQCPPPALGCNPQGICKIP
ncbi:MAG: hypothetical protein ABI183_18200 [Polyangiaceae bacterium]